MIFTQYFLSDVQCSLEWLSVWVVISERNKDAQFNVAVNGLLMIFTQYLFSDL